MNLPAFLASLGTLPQISFGMPLILWALAALPLLWWLLRVTPPLPRRAVFPPLRLLRGLKDEEQTPAATPWWLLLLRLLAAALLIAALADPLLGRSPRLTANGPLVLVVDNGWTAAKDWNARQDLIADLLRSARGRPVAASWSSSTPTPSCSRAAWGPWRARSRGGACPASSAAAC